METTTAEKHLYYKILDQKTLCDKDELRTSFSLVISAMYKNEVPLYADLVRIVKRVNQGALRSAEMIVAERLDLERHGAIRLGTPYELRTLRRIFALIGLYPAGYYDLSQAGLPVRATAFRLVQQESLAKNPFRMFTTLLRPELLDPKARDIALSLLLKRNIFTDELLTLTGLGEEQGSLLPEQGERFIIEVVKTFRWEAIAAATFEDFSQLQTEHPILADIPCFSTAHFNHLTPRTLDIEAAEVKMKENGLSVKANIEGPPARRNPILLRPTSFLALQEAIKFRLKGSSDLVDGYHRARFGEIEERGAALTVKGRQLYDYILSNSMQLKSDLASHSIKTKYTAH